MKALYSLFYTRNIQKNNSALGVLQAKAIYILPSKMYSEKYSSITNHSYRSTFIIFYRYRTLNESFQHTREFNPLFSKILLNSNGIFYIHFHKKMTQITSAAFHATHPYISYTHFHKSKSH